MSFHMNRTRFWRITSRISGRGVDVAERSESPTLFSLRCILWFARALRWHVRLWHKLIIHRVIDEDILRGRLEGYGFGCDGRPKFQAALLPEIRPSVPDACLISGIDTFDHPCREHLRNGMVKS